MSKYPCDADIYRIYWDEFPEDSYVGHTINLSDRMCRHRSEAKNGTALINQRIRERGLHSFKYEILESKWCESKKEACEIEKKWKLFLNSNLNMCSPLRTKEEMKEQHRIFMVKYNARPEVKAKMKIYNARPEVKAKKKLFVQRELEKTKN